MYLNYLKQKSKLGLLALSLCILGVVTVPAKASVIFVFEGTAPGTIAGTTNFIYDVNFQTNTDLGTGLPSDRFVGDTTTFGTLYDIAGFLTAVLNPVTAPFTVSSQLVGRTPIGISPTDSGTVTNVTVTYTGPTLTVDMSFPLVLVIDSTVNSLNVNGQYSGQDIKNAGAASGTPATNFGFVAIPTAVPEPGTMFALAGGVAMLLVGRLRLRSSR